MEQQSGRPPAIVIEDLTVSFPTKGEPLVALSGMSGRVAPGELVAVIGPNGCGKSTLLRAIAGLLPPAGGSVRTGPDGTPPRAGDGRIGVVFQQPRLLGWRSVLDNAAFPLELEGVSEAERRQAAERSLAQVGLSGAAGLRPRELSGGMQQRLALARSLVTDPEILLLDEPFSALDALTREAFNAELEAVWLARPRTVMVVTHSVEEAVALADRIWVMTASPGRLAADIAVPISRPRRGHAIAAPASTAVEAAVRDALAAAHAIDVAPWTDTAAPKVAA